jgi:iron complex outermembrane receptor protein
MRWWARQGVQRGCILAGVLGIVGLCAVEWPASALAETLASSPAADLPGTPVRLDPVVVSAGRVEQRLQDVPANVTVITREDIERSPARTVDDLLRQIPGFSLFRRSSSLVAQPTTQGVSLRGIGPSGVSRTLVLLDDVPLNDPFGGWVYWSRVPLESIERIEVVRGGGSALYGNYALGGVINIITRKRQGTAIQGKLDGGTRDTIDANLETSYITGPLGLALQGRVFSTGGYPIVQEGERGAVDIDADSRHQTFSGRVEHRPTADSSLFLTGSYFHEARGNGTPLQENDTESGALAAGGNLSTSDGSAWQLTVYSQLQTFDSTFTRIFDNRDAEALTLAQEVPSLGVGGVLQWTKQVLPKHRVTAGLDTRWIDGESAEHLFNFAGTSVVTRREVGGKQGFFGVFAQDIFTPLPRLDITAALRFDYWQNYDAFRTDRPLATGAVSRTSFPGRTDINLSPKLSLLYRAADALSLRGSFYQGFRAPTLNELYRQFRVQNVVTLANPDLGPERLTGGELGTDLVLGERWLARLTGFWNELEDPVSNVTLTALLPSDCPSGTVCRQRQNLGRTRSLGLEAEVRYTPVPAWELSLSYLYNESTITKFPADPALEGNRVPQVPKHTYTAGARYLNAKVVSVAVQGRFVGQQFEDDRNESTLGSFFVVDLSLWRPIPLPGASASEVFLAVENLFDKTYAVGKDPATGLVTIGMPLLVHGGLRFRF